MWNPCSMPSWRGFKLCVVPLCKLCAGWGGAACLLSIFLSLGRCKVGSDGWRQVVAAVVKTLACAGLLRCRTTIMAMWYSSWVLDINVVTT
jgi:hypothetical protein